MKKSFPLIFTILFFLNATGQIKQPVDYVNPLIGTEKSSHHTVWESKGATFPGVLLPFGMVQITPDGYMYSDKQIKSFSFLNHASGYTSHGSFNLMAVTGDSLSAGKTPSEFDHSMETTSPYYYRVMLKKYRINAEFTATERSALGKFTFPASNAAHFILSDISNVLVADSNTIRGRSGQYFFVAKFSKPFSSVEAYPRKFPLQIDSVSVATSKAILINYSTAEKEVVLIKIGFSTTSFQAVENNIQHELREWDFDQACIRSKEKWNQQLGKIGIKTSNENLKETFYTALYHSMFMPAISSDADAPQNIYGSLFPWDTYRCKHPLITLLDPERESDMVSSVLAEYDKTGWLATDNMMGNHNTELILDSYLKGASHFDVEKAAEAMTKSLLVPPYARREMNDFVKYQFVPANISSSVTHSLEFAYNNWAAANFLEQTGLHKKYLKEYEVLMERATYFKNSFDPATSFMRAKTASGQWADGGYAEGTEWTYSWYVPHDVQGLINLMGGKATFSKHLTECFDSGHFVHNNEPPMHYPYLFNFCGEPWKTQLYARQVVENSYSNDPGGLPGNDDLGTLSSWFVFSAMGFYPVTPGTTQYQIGSPVFDETIIHLPGGRQFIIKANHVSKENKYIQSANLNGVSLSRPWLTQQEIISGKILTVEMGPQPNRSWGSNDSNRPYSMTREKAHFILKDVRLSTHLVNANDSAELLLRVQNKSKGMGTLSLPVYIDGKLYRTISTVFDPGENRLIHSPVVLYQGGIHAISVEGRRSVSLEVQKTKAAFTYRDLKIPLPPLANLFDRIPVSAMVKNTGSNRASTSVKLLISGVEAATKIIELAAGEEKEIIFNCKLTKEGICNIGIENLPPVMLNVLKPGDSAHVDYASLASLKPLLIMNFDEEQTSVIPDFSGLDNNGIIKGKLLWVDGPFGKAIQTDASLGNYIMFPDSCSLDRLGRNTPLTMMAWVYPDEEKNFADIISKGDWNSLQVKGSNVFLNYYANGWEGHETTALVPENWNRQWHHIAGVSDGTDFELYLDGNLVATKSGEPRNPKGETGISDYSHSLWNIGRNETALDRVFHGSIDDVMVFKKALSRQQIIDLMLHNF